MNMLHLFSRNNIKVFVTVCIISTVFFTWYLSTQTKWISSKFIVCQKFDPFLNDSSVEGKFQTFGEKSMIIDTEGCKIPKFHPYDPTIIDLISPMRPYECPGNPVFIFPLSDGSIAANDTLLRLFYNSTTSKLSCYYQSIERKNERPGDVRENRYEIGSKKVLKFNEPLGEDHIMVNCVINNENYTQFIPVPFIRKEKLETEASNTDYNSRLNVILVGVDSISKLNFIRHLKKTRAFVEKHRMFEMQGYTKVADNTFPNIFALLSGQILGSVWNESLSDTMYFDDVDLIWRKYARKRYHTLFAEDMPLFGIFSYFRRGFYNSPTDFYYRPLSLAMHFSDLNKKSKKKFCLNSQTETDIIFNYLKDFIQTMENRPFFAFVMVAAITHDYFNYASYADEPTANLLETLWENGTLNKSALVLFSDHGIRFGKIRKRHIGKFEERMPFMYIHLPTWFLDKHPSFAENLRTNQERLITAYDVHATLVHLLDPLQESKTKQKETTTPNGISLLNEISEYRTCEMAKIAAPWCTCLDFHPISVTDTIAIRSGQTVVNFINDLLKVHKEYCTSLDLEGVSNILVGQANDLLLRFIKHENTVIDRKVVYGERIETFADYVITLTTKPNNGIYRASVRYNIEDNILTVMNIKRLNNVSGNIECNIIENLRQFCHCKQ